MQNSAKQSTRRGRRKSYISTWDQESQKKYNEVVNTQSPTEADCKASDLINHLNQNRRQRWEEAVESIDFSHSSRLTWQTFNRLIGRFNRLKRCSVSLNTIAHQLLCNGRHKNVDKEATRAVKQEIKQLWSTPTSNSKLSSPFTTHELEIAVNQVKCRKAMSIDKILPEFLKHSDGNFRNWLKRFFHYVFNDLLFLRSGEKLQ